MKNVLILFYLHISWDKKYVYFFACHVARRLKNGLLEHFQEDQKMIFPNGLLENQNGLPKWSSRAKTWKFLEKKVVFWEAQGAAGDRRRHALVSYIFLRAAVAKRTF